MTSNVDWSDLKSRLISAGLMIICATIAIAAGGLVLTVALAALAGFVVWELATMLGVRSPGTAFIMAVGAGIVSLLGSFLAMPLAFAVFVAASALASLIVVKLRVGFALTAFAALFAVFTIEMMREQSLVLVIWFICIIVASDVLGYFAGRTLGGPKFWPKISPKKTWSGTVAGWLGAAIVGFGFATAFRDVFDALPVSLPLAVSFISVLIALCGQLGDIAESAIKRRVGVKDSSNLIPGHGGFMDRFDAMIGGAVVLGLLTLIG